MGKGGRLAERRDTGQGQQQKGVIEENTVTDKGATNRRIFGCKGGRLAESRDTGQGQQPKGAIEDNTDTGAANRRIFWGALAKNRDTGQGGRN